VFWRSGGGPETCMEINLLIVSEMNLILEIVYPFSMQSPLKMDALFPNGGSTIILIV